jgi:hypothetical protein
MSQVSDDTLATRQDVQRVDRDARVVTTYGFLGSVITLTAVASLGFFRITARLDGYEIDREKARTEISELKAHVAHEIGAIARPRDIYLVEDLPKTRSGKIMRRILRKIAEGDVSNLGDISTLADPLVVDNLVQSRSTAV